MDARTPLTVRRHRFAALLLLPPLALRALIPVGFMPVPAAGSLALAFCEPPGTAVAASQLHHGTSDTTGHARHAGASDCPFAQSAGPALAPGIAAAAALPAALAAAPPPPALAPRAAPLRYAAPRGPPSRSDD